MQLARDPVRHVAAAAARFSGIFLGGVSAGVAFSHVLEKAPKKELAPRVYVDVQQNLYRRYGRAGAVMEPGAFASAAALALLGLGTRTRALAGAAAAIIAIQTGVWKFFIDPINKRSRKWTAEALPPDWARERDRWEALHTVRAGLAAAALGALILSGPARR